MLQKSCDHSAENAVRDDRAAGELAISMLCSAVHTNHRREYGQRSKGPWRAASTQQPGSFLRELRPFPLLFLYTASSLILKWENRATMGLRGLINRDLQRQSRILMVLPGFVKGQARLVEEKRGEEVGYLWILERHCVDTSTF